jgi:hypothetical protein
MNAVKPGQIVVGIPHGRRFRVVDAAVVLSDANGNTTEPLFALQALDNCKAVDSVLWPRDWFAAPGDQLRLAGV